MPTYNQDASWGLHDLVNGVIGVSNPWIGHTSIQLNEVSRTEFVEIGESYPVRGYSGIENDEVIAHALQEDFSELVGRTGEESSETRKEALFHTSFLGQDWFTPNFPSHNSDVYTDLDTHDHEESDQGGDDDDQNPSTRSEDLSILDGEVEKRLTKMNSILHIPRINGEIPTADDACLDHERLLARLKLYGLTECKMDGDGNCQFRALSDQLYRSPEHHKDLRDRVVEQLTCYPDLYEGYVPMKYNDYLDNMSKLGEWGDHVTLQAAADSYGVRICLLTSFRDKCFIEILPKQMKSKRAVFLSFWAEVHYNSIYIQDGLLLSPIVKKKKTTQWSKFLKAIR